MGQVGAARSDSNPLAPILTLISIRKFDLSLLNGASDAGHLCVRRMGLNVRWLDAEVARVY